MAPSLHGVTRGADCEIIKGNQRNNQKGKNAEITLDYKIAARKNFNLQVWRGLQKVSPNLQQLKKKKRQKQPKGKSQNNTNMK